MNLIENQSVDSILVKFNKIIFLTISEIVVDLFWLRLIRLPRLT